MRDLQTGTTRRVSLTSTGLEANGKSQCGSGYISGDGRYVLFWSEAKNLVPNDTNSVADFFVRDTLAGTTTRVSIGDQGQQGNDIATYGAAITRGGPAVTFWSHANNLITGVSLTRRSTSANEVSR